LKTALKKVEIRPNSITNWRNIWKVGNPTFRSILYKVAHKDVFCNTRRLNCKLTADNLCVICSIPEDFNHQLVDCPNARRFWLKCNSVFDIQINSIDDIMSMNWNKNELLIIAVVLKALIQIDRSKDLNWEAMVSRIKAQLNIENTVKRNINVTKLLLKVT